MPLEPGARLDAYEIVRPLGSGGMGEVWLATEVRLGRKVALKLLPADLTREPSRVLRFEQEARAASALNHPNVCTILALGETAEGLRYIAMEYIEGETLRQRLATTRLSIRQALDIAIQVAAALSAAHAAGIVHRDIKPENVMLRPDGFVKVLDFGLAKLASPAQIAGADSTRLVLKTEGGVVVGTAAYMSPEQARGQEVDARTDIWSSGVLLYEMVAGRSPFAAPSGSEVLAAILDRDPAPLARFEPDTPAELQRIVTKCLRKERALRYQVVQDFLLDLQTLRDEVQAQALSGSSPSAHVPPPPAQPSPSEALPAAARSTHLQRRTLMLGVAAIVLASLLVAAIGWWMRARTSRPAPTLASAPVERQLTRVTFGSGLQTDVTFSPDGRFVAYASDRAGNFDIWVQPVSSGDPVQVTKSPAQDTQPDWSPDGSTLVFRSEREGGGLFLVPALGGAEQRLTAFGTYPQWMPSGKEILFIDAAYSPVESAVGNDLRVYITAPNREQPTEILGDFVRMGGWRWVAAHPDGRISFYGYQRDRGVGFFTVSRDGKNLVDSDYASEVPSVLRDRDWQIRRFRWNEAGNFLYLETDINGVRNLWRADVDPHTLRWLSAVRLTTGSSHEGTLALSRDGTRLAFTVHGGATRLWSFGLDAQGVGLTDRGKPITEEDVDVHEFDLARDGRMVAQTVTRPGREGVELWTIDIDTGMTALVARQAGMPRWSFDGTQLAYVSFGGPARLIVRDAGRVERTVARITGDTPFPIPLDWTPDGSAILASWRSTSSAHWAITLWPTAKSSAQRPERTLLQEAHANLWQGRFSPNGRWISALSLRDDEPGRNTMVIAPAAGAPRAKWVEMMRDHLWTDKMRWSADGRTLYFISRRPTSFFNLWGVRFDPDRGTPMGQPFLLTHYDSPSLMISPQLDQSEIGVAARRVIIGLRMVTGNIWMLDDVDR